MSGQRALRATVLVDPRLDVRHRLRELLRRSDAAFVLTADVLVRDGVVPGVEGGHDDARRLPPTSIAPCSELGRDGLDRAVQDDVRTVSGQLAHRHGDGGETGATGAGHHDRGRSRPSRRQRRCRSPSPASALVVTLPASDASGEVSKGHLFSVLVADCEPIRAWRSATPDILSRAVTGTSRNDRDVSPAMPLPFASVSRMSTWVVPRGARLSGGIALGVDRTRGGLRRQRVVGTCATVTVIVSSIELFAASAADRRVPDEDGALARVVVDLQRHRDASRGVSASASQAVVVPACAVMPWPSLVRARRG